MTENINQGEDMTAKSPSGSITVNEDRTLSFGHVRDARYTFPVWSWMSSRGCRVFFKDGDKDEEIGGKFCGVLEVLALADEHRLADTTKAKLAVRECGV